MASFSPKSSTSSSLFLRRSRTVPHNNNTITQPPSSAAYWANYIIMNSNSSITKADLGGQSIMEDRVGVGLEGSRVNSGDHKGALEDLEGKGLSWTSWRCRRL
jgi:hypothetical protein